MSDSSWQTIKNCVHEHGECLIQNTSVQCSNTCPKHPEHQAFLDNISWTMFKHEVLNQVVKELNLEDEVHYDCSSTTKNPMEKAIERMKNRT